MTDEPLRLFLDRSVGTRVVAARLRRLDLTVETIADRYGVEAPSVPDVRWISDASRDGLLLLGADKRVRFNPLERRALCLHRARYLTFARGDLTAVQMVDRVESLLPAIRRLVDRPGPYVFHLTARGLVERDLDCRDC